MSERMIARWNAIPLERPSESLAYSKRKRDEEIEKDDDDNDDNVSLMSRSPSPLPHDAMDVDEQRIDKYDEYVRGFPREVITVDTKIKPTNKGFALLTKLGWREGQPVGLSPDGLTEPIPFYVKSDLTGLGKTNQDFQMIETTISQRRELDSERQQRETEEQRKIRENSVARKSALEAELSSTLKAFRCDLCDKQFKNVAQYDEHTNSYAHHHKARFRDMQASLTKPQEEIDKRKEKERKREEKEIRKIAAANGIKMPKPSTIASGSSATESTGGMDIDGTPTEPPKKGGWATISSGLTDALSHTTISSEVSKKSRWTTVGSAATPVPQPPESAPPPPPLAKPPPYTPSFRNAGWTTLETTREAKSNLSEPPSAYPHRTHANEATTPPPVHQTGAQPLTPMSQQVPLLHPSLSVLPPEAGAPRSNWRQFQKGRRK